MTKTICCQYSPKHPQPFFSVQVVTREVGPGTRTHTHPRMVVSRMVGTFCSDCLLTARIILEGKTLLTPEGDSKGSET